jgi:radical SAM superfamily enzyme YgiQ (UPF0313 family)
MADIVLVNPRFETSHWGLDYALPILHKRAAMPVAGLGLLAALTPAEHRVSIMDENVERLDFERLTRADLVGVTGMSVQRHRMREILTELRTRGVPSVAGGPWVTAREKDFEGLVDAVFVGEAERTWPLFLEQWRRGAHQARYEQQRPTDMTTVPVPRWDLYKTRHYLFGSLQLSRGCPFRCEFCDIIVTFGRRPRLKTSAQMIAEVEALCAHGMKIVFIVDDNLAGDKRAMKTLLRDLIGWQEENGYPLIFVAEASLDLADDQELLDLAVEANIQNVFIGIESPNPESLRETKKNHNIGPRPDSLVERIHKIQDKGIAVWGGLIVGFDNDDQSIFDAHRKLISEARILQPMVGMLSAIPKTPLYDRLAAESRLDLDDLSGFGTNVIPLTMSREELRDGFIELMLDAYRPRAYFSRFAELYFHKDVVFGPARIRYWRDHPWSRVKDQGLFLIRAAYLFVRLMICVPETELRVEYRTGLRRLLKVRRDPAMVFGYLLSCCLHYHHWTMARQMARGEIPIINTF